MKFNFGQFVVFMTSGNLNGVYKIMPYYKRDSVFPIEYKVILVHKSGQYDADSDVDMYSLDLNGFITDDNLFDDIISASNYYWQITRGKNENN